MSLAQHKQNKITAETMTDLAEDLENWMSRMPRKLRNIPIINLAIPGTHDSMWHGIKKHAPIAPDAATVIGGLYKIMPCVIRRWAVTQLLTPTEQLNFGIRYFDLRICLRKTDNKFYFVHGLYCKEIFEPFREIKTFLDAHPNEFVILDCQHFYEFSDKAYEILANHIIQIFGSKIYSLNDGELNTLTLESAKKLDKQVLVVYRNDIWVPYQFWESGWWPTPWPNQIKVDKLQKYLESSLKHRTPEIGYVNQCVLTPPANFIVPRFFSSLRYTCAQSVSKGLLDWIKAQKPGPFICGDTPTSNVFIADFIDIENYQFSKTVISLNMKLLTKNSYKENDLLK